MKIAVIGTGNVGSALGGSLVRAGHEVVLAARDADKTRQVAQKVGARAADEPAQAVRDAEAVILAVPYDALLETASEIGDAAAGKVVIDATNPGPATAGGPSAAERLAERLPNAHVSKAFNTLFGSFMAQPDLQGQKVDALFATDSDAARPRVSDVLTSLGFRAVDVGSLDAARGMEAMAWLNIQLQLRYGGDWRSTFVMIGAPQAAVAEPAHSA